MKYDLLVKLYIVIGCSAIIFSCKKSEFLDDKPDSNIVIPETLADLRSLLDNTGVFMQTPALGEISADDYYLTFPNWQALTSIVDRNTHVWEKDLYGGTGVISDWNIPYQQVLYCNVVLEQLPKIQPSVSELAEWKDINGAALFQRGFAFYNLAANFAPAYDSSTANTDLGIPIRLNPDVNNLVSRSFLKETYDQILSDVHNSVSLLSNFVHPSYRNRPSKPAAYALLSRIYLSMRIYDKALKYSDSCLSVYNKLIQYDTVSTTASTPFIRANDETIYSTNLISRFPIIDATSTIAYIDTLLYRSYSTNDQRKLIFFRLINGSGNNYGIKRGYTGTVFPFSGFAVDEVYLNRAECLARAGNTAGAMNDLNFLLRARWKKINGVTTYIDQTALNAQDALSKILVERRKELVFRGLRWIDLKRLNKEGANIILKRILNGQAYTLLPNSPLYVLPIPNDEIALSGLIQNPR